jgi:hypothetical protein
MTEENVYGRCEGRRATALEVAPYFIVDDVVASATYYHLRMDERCCAYPSDDRHTTFIPA